MTIGSTILMSGVALFAYTKTNGSPTNDADKIQRIFLNAGWVGKDKGTTASIRLQRKRPFKGGVEYVYQIPLGFDRKQVEDNKYILEDGLNVRHKTPVFELSDLKQLKLDRTIIRQLRKILFKNETKKKEVDISFDGMLKIRVYNEQMPEKVNYDDSMLPGGWKVPVGQSRSEFIFHDFEKKYHIVVAGESGFGKSQFLKMLITCLIMQNEKHVSFSLFDLKGGATFNRFKDCKQVVRCTKDLKETQTELKEVQKEMNNILEAIVENGYEDVVEAGIKERHFIVIDEAFDLAQDGKSIGIVEDIARRGRSAGYRLVYCTQYPTNEAITSQIRANLGARVCFPLGTATQSVAVLDEKGANELPEIQGRAIYKQMRKVEVQTPYITNKQVKERIAPYIVIKAREEKQDGQQDNAKTTESNKYTFEFEKVGLPNTKAAASASQSKRRQKRA